MTYPTEEQEQAALFKWADLMRVRYPELQLMFHIPNEGARGLIGGARQKEQGLKSGVPDIFIPVARGKYHGMFVEMKRSDGGTESKNQKKWRDALREQGYNSVVCHGWDKARELIEYYMQEGK